MSRAALSALLHWKKTGWATLPWLREDSQCERLLLTRYVALGAQKLVGESSVAAMLAPCFELLRRKHFVSG
jgi:hypothetical protein